MLRDVDKYIHELEIKFFEEENSEDEVDLSSTPKSDNILVDNSHIKQFYCIPLSVNVKKYDF
jgi:hypothetical protein